MNEPGSRRAACQQIGDTKQQFIAEWGLWHVYVGRAEHRRARQIVDRLNAWAERDQDTDQILQACHAEWSTHSFLGEHEAARATCERGWELYDHARHGSLAFVYGAHDPGVCSRNHGARDWCLGYPDRARACYEDGLALARELAHPQIIVHALNWGMPLFQLCRDRARLKGGLTRGARTRSRAGSRQLPDRRADTQRLGAGREGEIGDAIHLMRAGLAERQERGTLFLHPYYLSLFARAQARVGGSTPRSN